MADDRQSTVILHVDLDCFYAAVSLSELLPTHSLFNLRSVSLPLTQCRVVQVEQVRLGIPQAEPLAVQQWDGLIAVSYSARKFGIARHDRVSEALRKCPNLHLVHVETIGCDDGKVAAASRNSAKVSLERYRHASRLVFEIFHRYADICERASIDEAYLDVTSQVDKMVEEGCDWDNELQRLVGIQDTDDKNGKQSDMIVEGGPLITNNVEDRRLLAGAIIADMIRTSVRSELGYTCSVGIATTKVLSKIATGRHKPDKQTIIPPRAVQSLMKTLPLKKVKLLGGKAGDELAQKWGCETAGDAQNVPLSALVSYFGDRLGQYVWRAVRGLQEDKVQEKQMQNSMLAAKSFQPTNDISVIRRWLGVLSDELSVRMLWDSKINKRQPHVLHLYYRSGNMKHRTDHSKSCSMPSAILTLLSSHCSNPVEVTTDEQAQITMNEESFEGHGVQRIPLMEPNPLSTTDFEPMVHESSDADGKCNIETKKAKDFAATKVTDATKLLPKLLQQASLRLFERTEGAFPCTRLAISASGFQEGPVQGIQSIRHFFGNASNTSIATPKCLSNVVNKVAETDKKVKCKGILKYIDRHESHSDPQSPSSRLKSTSEYALPESGNISHAVDMNNPGDSEDGNHGWTEKQQMESATFAPSHITGKFQESVAFSAPLPTAEKDRDKATSDSPSKDQSNSSHGANPDLNKETDLMNIDVEEQRRILKEIYAFQAMKKSGNAVNRSVPPHERRSLKRKNTGASSSTQSSISQFFGLYQNNNV